MRKALQSKIDTLRATLKSTMQEHFDRELNNSIQSLYTELGPYSRFVKSESERLGSLETKFANTTRQLQDLRVKIQEAFPSEVVK
jgi:hypothetical protein